MHKNESLKILNNPITYDRGVLKMRNEKWEMRNQKWEWKWEIRNENGNEKWE